MNALSSRSRPVVLILIAIATSWFSILRAEPAHLGLTYHFDPLRPDKT